MKYGLVVVGLSLSLALLGSLVGSSARAADGASDWERRDRKPVANGVPLSANRTTSKLSAPLQSVASSQRAPAQATVNSAATSYDQMEAWFASGILRERDGRLQVYVHTDGPNNGLKAAIESLGGSIEMESENKGIIQASVPMGVLEALSHLEGVARVTEPSYGVVNIGSNLTQGDSIMDFNDLRSLQGLDGSGVTVGVISDGIAGLAAAVASGDLPATSESRPGGVLTSTSGGVISSSFRADGDLEAGLGASSGAEGTAILEIVHDIAPGAQLRFANFSTSVTVGMQVVK